MNSGSGNPSTSGWHPDPNGAHEFRYFDGVEWTEHVANGGVQSSAPLQTTTAAPVGHTNVAPPGGQPSGQPAFGSDDIAEAKGLLKSLFDFRFSSLITTKIIRFLYAIVVGLATIGAVVVLIAGLASGKPANVFISLIVVPVGYLVYLILVRLFMESLIVVFRISDDLHAIRLKKGA